MPEEQVASTPAPAATEQPSKPEVVSTTPAVSQTEKPPEPAPLSREEVQKLIEQKSEEWKNIGKREMQAIKDREVAEVKRKADLAERRARSLDAGLSTLDEETRAKLEHTKTQGELDYYRSRDQQEEYAKQQEVYKAKLFQSLRDEVTAMGLNPDDKRIDFAQDSTDYFEGRKRFSESTSKILKAEKDAQEKTILSKAEERQKQLESEFRKKYGLDSHDTTSSAGVVNQTDADFLKKWGDYEIPSTPENLKRYAEIVKKY